MVRKIMAVSVAGALLAGPVPTYAGGFAVGTQSGSGTGNAFAGGSAAADDASVAWFNPAAMTALPAGKHIAGALHAVRPSFKFNNGGSTGPIYAGATAFDSGDGGDWNFIPNGFFVMDVGSAWRLGLALNAPFGLKTDYDFGWRGVARCRH